MVRFLRCWAKTQDSGSPLPLVAYPRSKSKTAVLAVWMEPPGWAGGRNSVGPISRAERPASSIQTAPHSKWNPEQAKTAKTRYLCWRGEQEIRKEEEKTRRKNLHCIGARCLPRWDQERGSFGGSSRSARWRGARPRDRRLKVSYHRSSDDDAEPQHRQQCEASNDESIKMDGYYLGSALGVIFAGGCVFCDQARWMR